MHFVEKPEALHRPRTQIIAAAGVGLESANVDVAEIHRRMTVEDPIGQNPTNSTRRLDPD